MTVGRFGVGFAAVLAVTDRPDVASTTGSVGWDVERARTALDAVPVLHDEAGRRHGQLPVLRLPWPSPSRPEDGFDTTVRLPLRDAAAVELVRRLLAEVDDALLLALPALTEIVVEVDGARRVVADADRWRVVRRSGQLEPALLADRPVEERDRPWWSLAWALPRAGQPVPPVLHAPTPTDEPLDLPALLIGSFPLDPTRRHVAPGPLTDALVALAAQAYAELAGAEADPLALLPGPMAAGRLDGQLRAAVLAQLRGTPLLPTTDGTLAAPVDASAVVGADDALRGLLSSVLGPLVADHPALERAGGRRLSMVEAVELLAGIERVPAWWRELYEGLATVTDPEVLAVLPVPLADGRLVRGARGALLPGPDLERAEGLDRLGLRLVHPDAVHPLLTRAGATEATARSVLAAPELAAAVDAAWDDPDPTTLSEIVLPLVAAGNVRPGEVPSLSRLSALPLRDDAGEPAPADELVLPGSPLAAVADPEAVGIIAADLVRIWGPSVLAAVGVLGGFTVVEVAEVDLDAPAETSPPGLDAEALDSWATAARGLLADPATPAVARDVLVVPELDVVAADRWPDALRALAGDPRSRAAVTRDAVIDTGSATVAVPSYGSWFLRSNALLDGRSPGEWALSGSGLDGLYDELDPGIVAGIDAELLAAAGVRTSLDALLVTPGDVGDLFDRLADESRTVSPSALDSLWPALAGLDPDRVLAPARLRVAPDLVVDADSVAVIDRPEHLQVLPREQALVVALSQATALADVLDVDLSSERLDDPDLSGGNSRDVPLDVVGVLTGAPTRWWEHDSLQVDGREVSWWRGADGSVHATNLDGLARGLAAAADRWDLRLVVARILADPGAAESLRAEGTLDG